ncbi:C39 family peptidase [Candidatus Uhrbacteria bacterium]|nr:C39 family peptidase [Candidatus Uhrbacteria bacterium]
MKWTRNCVELIILIAIIATVYTQRVGISNWFREITEPTVPEAVEYKEVQEAEEAVEVGEAVEVEKTLLPEPVPLLDGTPPKAVVEGNADDVIEEFNLAVPFTSQAPHANWDLPYKEACEEASLYMVHAYYEGIAEGKIAADTADAEILKIVEFEKKLFGFYEDTTVEQTGTISEMMYGHEKFELIENPTVDQIKTHVVAGHPVIVPAAGRLLGNPNFTAPGPIYHMIVIRGYTKDGKFITNDPGTKNGEAYIYDFDTVMNAMHDWNDGAEITEGKKVVLIVYP